MHVGPLRQHATHADSVLEFVARSLDSQVVQEEDELNRRRARLEKLPPLSIGRHGEQLGYHSRWFEAEDRPLKVVLDLGRLCRVDSIVLAPVSTVFQGVQYPSYGFPRRFSIELGVDATFEDACTVFDTGAKDVEAPGHYPFFVEVDGLEARFVRMHVTRQWRRPDGRCLTALAELMVLSGARNVAVGG